MNFKTMARATALDAFALASASVGMFTSMADVMPSTEYDASSLLAQRVMNMSNEELRNIGIAAPEATYLGDVVTQDSFTDNINTAIEEQIKNNIASVQEANKPLVKTVSTIDHAITQVVGTENRAYAKIAGYATGAASGSLGLGILMGFNFDFGDGTGNQVNSSPIKTEIHEPYNASKDVYSTAIQNTIQIDKFEAEPAKNNFAKKINQAKAFDDISTAVANGYAEEIESSTPYKENNEYHQEQQRLANEMADGREAAQAESNRNQIHEGYDPSHDLQSYDSKFTKTEMYKAYSDEAIESNRNKILNEAATGIDHESSTGEHTKARLQRMYGAGVKPDPSPHSGYTRVGPGITPEMQARADSYYANKTAVSHEAMESSIKQEENLASAHTVKTVEENIVQYSNPEEEIKKAVASGYSEPIESSEAYRENSEYHERIAKSNKNWRDGYEIENGVDSSEGWEKVSQKYYKNKAEQEKLANEMADGREAIKNPYKESKGTPFEHKDELHAPFTKEEQLKAEQDIAQDEEIKKLNKENMPEAREYQDKFGSSENPNSSAKTEHSTANKETKPIEAGERIQLGWLGEIDVVPHMPPPPPPPSHFIPSHLPPPPPSHPSAFSHFPPSPIYYPHGGSQSYHYPPLPPPGMPFYPPPMPREAPGMPEPLQLDSLPTGPAPYISAFSSEEERALLTSSDKGLSMKEEALKHHQIDKFYKENYRMYTSEELKGLSDHSLRSFLLHNVERSLDEEIDMYSESYYDMVVAEKEKRDEIAKKEREAASSPTEPSKNDTAAEEEPKKNLEEAITIEDNIDEQKKEADKKKKSSGKKNGKKKKNKKADMINANAEEKVEKATSSENTEDVSSEPKDLGKSKKDSSKKEEKVKNGEHGINKSKPMGWKGKATAFFSVAMAAQMAYGMMAGGNQQESMQHQESPSFFGQYS